MKIQNLIRNFVILASVIIFCYQLTTALNKLLSDATVDSSEEVPISELEYPPLITICPRQGKEWKSVEKWGYSKDDLGYEGNILTGNYRFRFIWDVKPPTPLPSKVFFYPCM